MNPHSTPTGRMDALIAWTKTGSGGEWLLGREDAERLVGEIEWGWAAAERETDLATKLDEALALLTEAYPGELPTNGWRMRVEKLGAWPVKSQS